MSDRQIDFVPVERWTNGPYCHRDCDTIYIHFGGDCVLFRQPCRRTPKGVLRCQACLDTPGLKEGGK